MAHFVGKTLHIRPNEILDTWGVPELVVAFGFYADEITLNNYEQWKEMAPSIRSKQAPPKKYLVEFYGLDRLGEE